MEAGVAWRNPLFASGAPRPAATPKSRDAAAQFCQLGNDTRLAIVRMLVRAGPPGLAVGAIRDVPGIPDSTLSHHLRQLRRAGLLVRERRGTVLRCQADYDAIGSAGRLSDRRMLQCRAERKRQRVIAMTALSTSLPGRWLPGWLAL